MRLGSQLVLSRYRTSIVAFVLRHGSRSIEGVYLKSPEMSNVTVLSVYYHDTVVNITIRHILYYSDYDRNT